MARITVTDCLDKVENRFQLVLVASKRARQIVTGSEPLLPEENDKPTVMALREISAGLVGPSILDQINAREHSEESRVSEEELRENEAAGSIG